MHHVLAFACLDTFEHNERDSCKEPSIAPGVGDWWLLNAAVPPDSPRRNPPIMLDLAYLAATMGPDMNPDTGRIHAKSVIETTRVRRA